MVDTSVRLRFMSGVQGPPGDLTEAAADELYVAKGGGVVSGFLSIIYPGDAFGEVTGTESGSYWLGHSAAGVDLKWVRLWFQDGVLAFVNYTDDLVVKNTPLQLSDDGSSSFGGVVSAPSFTASAAYPTYIFHDTDGPVDQKRAEFGLQDGVLGFHRYTDASVYIDTPFSISPDAVNVTGSLRLGSWTTGTRPASPEDGTVGVNTTTGELEVYLGAWRKVTTTAV
jgi:hypothetical protein